LGDEVGKKGPKLDDSDLGHSFGHIPTRKQPIWEGDMPFESPKCPLKSGLTNFLKIKIICKIIDFSSKDFRFILLKDIQSL
jgi:hypothetical protein